MAIEVYLIFNGNCREAVEFYTKAFGSETPKIMTYGDAPPNPEFTLPEEAKNLIMHTRLTIAGSNVMLSDICPGMPVNQGNNISLTVISKNIDEIKSIFTKLKEGGTVQLEPQETFWSKCYASLTDKFGIPWQLNYDGGNRM